MTSELQTAISMINASFRLTDPREYLKETRAYIGSIETKIPFLIVIELYHLIANLEIRVS